MLCAGARLVVPDDQEPGGRPRPPPSQPPQEPARQADNPIRQFSFLIWLFSQLVNCHLTILSVGHFSFDNLFV